MIPGEGKIITAILPKKRKVCGLNKMFPINTTAASLGK